MGNQESAHKELTCKLIFSKSQGRSNSLKNTDDIREEIHWLIWGHFPEGKGLVELSLEMKTLTDVIFFFPFLPLGDLLSAGVISVTVFQPNKDCEPCPDVPEDQPWSVHLPPLAPSVFLTLPPQWVTQASTSTPSMWLPLQGTSQHTHVSAIVPAGTYSQLWVDQPHPHISVPVATEDKPFS